MGPDQDGDPAVEVFQRFLTLVRLGTDSDRHGAERVAQAVLTTLFERISGGQADDLVQRLKPPDGFVPGTLTLRTRPADHFGLDEFLRRVAEREHVDEDVARAHTTTVLRALQLVVPRKEFADTADQLPGEFAELLSAQWRPFRPLITVQDLLQLVADRGGMSTEEAGRFTEAVLEVLAERLPDKEVDELAQRMPDDLRTAVERGRARRTAPRRLDVDGFLELIAERMQTDPHQARQHARTVLEVLTEVFDDRLLADLLIQLPDDYADLLCPGRSPAGSG
jgi:uncharacterized protein (DUF2267 family)